MRRVGRSASHAGLLAGGLALAASPVASAMEPSSPSPEEAQVTSPGAAQHVPPDAPERPIPAMAYSGIVRA